MSDSDSIQFMEFSERDSMNSARPSNGPMLASTADVLSKMHANQAHSQNAGILSVAGAASNRGAHPKPPAVHASLGQAESEFSESINFQLDGTLGGGSTGSGPVFVLDEQKGSVARSRRDQASADIDEESVNFFMEGSHSFAAKVEPSHRGSMDTDSIVFNIADDKTSDLAVGKRTVSGLHGTSEAANYHVATSAPTSTRETTGAHALVPQTQRGADVGSMRFPSTKLNRKPQTVSDANKSNILSRTTLSSVIANGSRSIGKQSNSPAISKPAKSEGAVTATGLVVSPISKETGPENPVCGSKATSTGRPHDEKHYGVRPQLIRNTAAERNAADTAISCHAAGSHMDDTSVCAKSEAQITRTASGVDLGLVVNGGGVQELVLQAKLYTEHWRLYNDLQREDISRLSRRIKEAHDANCVSEFTVGSENVVRKWDGKGDRGRAYHTRNTVAPTYRGKSRVGALPPGKDTGFSLFPEASLGDDCVQQLANDKGNCMGVTHKGAASSYTCGGLKQKSLRNSRSELLSRFEGAGVMDAIAKFAQSMGIVWPPPSRDEIYFSTGRRLTPQQREKFYRAVEFQGDKLMRYRETSRSSIEIEKAAVPEDNKRKSGTTRTSLLRQAFVLLDVDKEGIVQAASLPAIQRLLRTEWEELNKVARGVMRMDALMLLPQDPNQQNVDANDTVAIHKNASAGEVAVFERQLTLYSLVMEVVLPLLISSGLMSFDFATLGLLVFGTADSTPSTAGPGFQRWRATALRCFQSCAENL